MQRDNIIAAAGSLLGLVTGTVFALLYTELKIKSFCGDRMVALPYPCLLFHRLALSALLVPAGFMVAFGVLLKRQNFDQSATVLFVVSSGLFTLSWVLACLLIWELPYIGIAAPL